jgi:hypothetical protein
MHLHYAINLSGSGSNSSGSSSSESVINNTEKNNNSNLVIIIIFLVYLFFSLCICCTLIFTVNRDCYICYPCIYVYQNTIFKLVNFIKRCTNKLHNDPKIKIYVEKIKLNKENKEMECSICFEKINKKSISLKCNHIFHKECISKWLQENNSCPLCREKVYNKQIVYANQDEYSSDDSYDIFDDF